jgi:type IV pilus assembly protein PilW
MIKNTQQLPAQAGFTIIELMVGMVIGLIATVVIMQTFSNFEGNKRSTTGIADAQTNGSIGLYMIQRELQFAGYGIPAISGVMPEISVAADQIGFEDYTDEFEAGVSEEDIFALQKTAQDAAEARYTAQLAQDAITVSEGKVYSALRCNPAPTLMMDDDADAATPNVAVDIITPVAITNGANSDTIVLRYGTTNRGAIAVEITGPVAGTNVPISNNMGCRNNDVVLVTRNSNAPDSDTNCVATRVTTTNAALNAGPFNTISVTSAAGMAQGNRLSCLGQVMVVRFGVNGDNQLTKNNQPVISEIVSLQAQYGVSDTANSEVVKQWVDAVGATWAAPTVANRNRIKAVRVALVARNNLREKTQVTEPCSSLTAAAPTGLCAWPGTATSPAPQITFANADWQNYRYRVYEVMIPIRNVLAASPQL